MKNSAIVGNTSDLCRAKGLTRSAVASTLSLVTTVYGSAKYSFVFTLSDAGYDLTSRSFALKQGLLLCRGRPKVSKRSSKSGDRSPCERGKMPEGTPLLHRTAALNCEQAAPQAGTSEPAA